MDNQLEKQIDKILPEDISRTLESAYHVVFQGDYDHVDDLLKHGGTLIRKAAQRFTSTQMILGIAAIAAVAVVVVSRAAASDDEGEATDASEPKLSKAE
ncbi:hypothetical protein J0X19_06900 [Hymenobacter sp. BT186]|uniref:Recombination associated protein RdgC n=2 Tax=Hymenobacter telluris TaxID=2816474 RepID=A0A939EXE6_9BACT|nr:hypothetical protein [Hymenobacter telluris]MBW3373695.1 hypothetical protein [Hymenobacter norwichensis]